MGLRLVSTILMLGSSVYIAEEFAKGEFDAKDALIGGFIFSVGLGFEASQAGKQMFNDLEAQLDSNLESTAGQTE